MAIFNSGAGSSAWVTGVLNKKQPDGSFKRIPLGTMSSNDPKRFPVDYFGMYKDGSIIHREDTKERIWYFFKYSIPLSFKNFFRKIKKIGGKK
jgi:hypothetical protein